MTDTSSSEPRMPSPTPSRVPAIAELSVADLFDALAAGWRDFAQKPALGLLFGAVFVIGGLLIYFLAVVSGLIWYAIPITVGFPLLGPFFAVGLY